MTTTPLGPQHRWRSSGAFVVAAALVFVGAVGAAQQAAASSGQVAPSTTPVPPPSSSVTATGAVPVVVLSAAGDPTTATDLTPVYDVGTHYAVTTDYALLGSSVGEGSTLALDATATIIERGEVTASSPDGSYTAIAVAESVDVTENASEGTSAFYLPVAEESPLLGVPIEVSINPESVAVGWRPAPTTSPTPDHLALLESFAAVGDTGPISLPSEPVGVGARWLVSYPPYFLQGSGPVVYEYELVSNDGVDVEIAYRWSGAIAGTVEDSDLGSVTVEGGIEGNGTLTTSVTAVSERLEDKAHATITYAVSGRSVIVDYDLWTAWTTSPG